MEIRMSKSIFGEIISDDYTFRHQKNEEPTILDVKPTPNMWSYIKLGSLEFVDPKYKNVKSAQDLVDLQRDDESIQNALRIKKSNIKKTQKTQKEIEEELEKTKTNAENHVGQKITKKQEKIKVFDVNDVIEKEAKTLIDPIAIPQTKETESDVDSIIAETLNETKKGEDDLDGNN